MRRSKLRFAGLLVATCGCGEAMERPVPVAMDQVPAVVKDAAAKALPDVKFDQAQTVTEDGKNVYEMRGKTKTGKIREVEVTPSGEVVQIE
jgi:hypothetical protein